MRTAILVFLAFAAFAGGYGYHGVYLLDGPIAPPNCAASGMGGLSVLPPEAPGNALWAPALLPKEGIRAAFDLDITHLSENRAMPLYDTFEDRAGWITYASSAETYGGFSALASYSFEGKFLPTISAGYARVFDASFTYREQLRNDSGADADILIGVWSIDSEGGLAGPVIALSERILKYGSVGFSAAILSGSFELHRSAEIGDSAVHNATDWERAFDEDSIYSTDLSGTMISLSAVATPTDRWQIGIRYTPEVELDESLYPDLLPARLGLGIAFRPPGYVLSRVAFEAELVRYSGLAEADPDFEALEDCWEFRFGLEHTLPGNLPLRIGAYQRRIPLLDPVAKTGFTLGGGKGFGNFRLDLACRYEMTEYYHHDLFPETWLPSPYSTDDRTDNDRVQEATLTGFIGIEIDF